MFFPDRLFRNTLMLPRQTTCMFFRGIIGVFMLAGTTLPTSLKSKRFSLPSRFRDILGATTIRMISSHYTGLFLGLLISMPFQMIRLFLGIDGYCLILMVLFRVNYSTRRRQIDSLVFTW